MLFIHQTLLQDNISIDNACGTLLAEIIAKHRSDSYPYYDAQAIFQEIARLDGWTYPSENNSETAVSPMDKIYPVILHDGTKAAMVIFFHENGETKVPHVNIFRI